MRRRILSLLLAFALVLGMLPLTAAAAEAPPDDAVTVYFTVEGKDATKNSFATAGGKTMALQKLTVPYFDLALYGMEDLYYNPDCYAGAGQASQTAGTKEIAKGKVTLLHLFIYATEVFQCDIPPKDAGKGLLADLDWPYFDVYQRYPGSAFVDFWGYGNDITYYRNYQYPLGEVGWGATCDQIRIYDGEVITVRHDNGTEGYGTYHHFDNPGLITKEQSPGNQLYLTLYKTTKSADYSGTGHEPVGEGIQVSVVSEIGGTALVQATTNATGDVQLDTSGLSKGRYYVTSDTYGPAVMLLLIGEHDYFSEVTAPTCTTGGYTTYTCACGSSYVANRTPATGHAGDGETCTVCGGNTAIAMYGDVDGDKSITATDVSLVAQHAAGLTVTIDLDAADVDGDKNVTATDVSLIAQRVANLITQFPAEGTN